MKTGNRRTRGYVLLAALFAVHIAAVFMLMGRARWQTVIRRDLEAELVFRARQYVRAIESYAREHLNQTPPSLRILEEENHIRRLYTDPLSATGEWNLVMKPGSGSKKLLIVPLSAVGRFLTEASIVGVCSTSPESGFMEYRGRKRYNEWAFYLGEDPEEEMPALEYAGGA
ncbi:MAG: type II secretion system protein [Candidatus Aminicenantes bacterium]|nr:type II secretion system protein [Candidatus Aminicenantes bacterium]